MPSNIIVSSGYDNYQIEMQFSFDLLMCTSFLFIQHMAIKIMMQLWKIIMQLWQWKGKGNYYYWTTIELFQYHFMSDAFLQIYNVFILIICGWKSKRQIKFFFVKKETRYAKTFFKVVIFENYKCGKITTILLVIWYAGQFFVWDRVRNF